MVEMFTPLFAFAVVSMAISVARFCRSAPLGPVSEAAAAEAVRDVLTLKYLDGGHGEGCNEQDDRWTLARRRYHHLTFYGFLLCFAATCVATTYHYALGWMAPHGWTSLPKLLGVPGGLALVVGTAGLAHYRWHRHPQHQVEDQRPMDMAFIGLLFVTGASGLALALAHGTPAMPILLCVHLGSVMAFFATMPYGKFAHTVYRSAALLKWATERRQPSGLKLSDD
jgi:citrate/tricarballylate utilization protein